LPTTTTTHTSKKEFAPRFSMGCSSSKPSKEAASSAEPSTSKMAAARRFFVGGNWKMNGTKASYKELLGAWKDAKINDTVDVVIGVPSPYLQFVRDEMRADFQVSSQDCLNQLKGAFTGAISPEMILDNGATWAIVGHSERRELFGEDNAVVAEKTAFAVANGLSVMSCVGEKKEDREAEKTFDVVDAQMAAIAAKVTGDAWAKVVIAYEPVWAIGTGLTASPEQAQDVHAHIRGWLKENVSAEVADATRILYGGSVKPANCQELAKCADIDGFLVGGASLKPDFISVINAETA